mgnify:CR=1 FL=1
MEDGYLYVSGISHYRRKPPGVELFGAVESTSFELSKNVENTLPGLFRVGEMKLATKDHIEHIEYDGEMNWNGRGGSPGRFALPWGGAVAGRDERPRSSAWGLGVLVAWGNRGWLKPPPPEEGFGK